LDEGEIIEDEAEYYDEAEYHIENNVIFEGYQTNTKKYYNMFDFIILPSISEGCAYNIIETFTNGLPIICSNVGGNHELVKNEVNGIIYPYTNIRKYEQKVVYITSYNEHLSSIGYLINKNIEEYYDFIYNSKDYQLDVVIPLLLKCKKINNTTNISQQSLDKELFSHRKDNINHNIIKCNYCNILNNKINLFNENTMNIINAITNMINKPDEDIIKISNNNIDFINNNFNKNIYHNELLEIVK
jgi:hypothetical protein